MSLGSLLFVTSSPDSTISLDRYHNWYDNEHLPARLTVPGVRSALRYKSVTRNKTFLAYYDLDSDEVLKSPEYIALNENASDEERAVKPHAGLDRRLYKEIARVGKQAPTPPKTLLVVEMTPYPGHENEFNHWYDTYHIPQMGEVAGWSRSRRFLLTEPLDSGVCKYLTLHEFDRYNALGSDRSGTVKWRNEVIEIVAQRDRSIWEPYHAKDEPEGTHIVFHDGIQFNVRIDGKEDGPILAFSNPLGLNLSVWDNVVAALAPKFRLIRHDQRGHGRTSQPTKVTSFSELADDIVGILDYLNVQRLHALVGLSMGAIVCLDFALRYPLRVEKIIPCDGLPVSHPDIVKAWHTRIKVIEEQGAGVLAEQAVDRWLTPGFKKDPANQKTIQWLRENFSKTPANAFRVNALAMEDYDYITPAKNIKLPALLVCGAQGPTLELMKQLEKVIPGAELVVIDKCGHLPMIEQPKAYIDILKASL